MKQFKLKKNGIILILVLVLLLAGGGIWWGVNSGLIENDVGKSDKDNQSSNVSNTTNEPSTTTKPSTTPTALTTNGDNEVDLSIDEWVGYATILQANGGLQTQPGSIFDQLGIKVNISIINDATQSSNALIKGELDGAGYTVNRLAFLSNKFNTAGVDVVMPFITNYSNGGDGIIAKSSITSINDLVGAKIGVPQFSESQAMLVWFVNQSNLSQSEKDDIIKNLIMFETADEAAKAFFAGQIDAAGTWQPYLTQAQNMTDSHILFSTASSTKLILSGIVFREDWAQANPETLSKFIDGVLQARDLYDIDLDVLRQYMPMFSGMSDEDIIAMTKDADLTTWKDNMNILDGDAKTIYKSMCDTWESLGETVDASKVDEIFVTDYMAMLSDKYESIVDDTPETKPNNAVVVTDENRESLEDVQAMLTRHVSIEFMPDTAKFLDSAAAAEQLTEFIDIANILDGSIIRIEGNTNPIAGTPPDNEGAMLLSQQRAETVKNYLVMNGISADRIIAVGNGGTKPLDTSGTKEGQQSNRRTDISFLLFEG